MGADKKQEERLDYLLHEFKEDSGRYRDQERITERRECFCALL